MAEFNEELWQEMQADNGVQYENECVAEELLGEYNNALYDRC